MRNSKNLISVEKSLLSSKLRIAIMLIALTFGNITIAFTQPGIKKLPKDPKKFQEILKTPMLQVRLFSKEFERWEREKVVDQPGTITLRFGNPIYGTTAIWELWEANSIKVTTIGIKNKPLAKGVISNYGGSEQLVYERWHQFPIDLSQHLPTNPPSTPKEYNIYITLYIDGYPSPASPPVKIIHQKPPDYDYDFGSPEFTEHPELYNQGLLVPKPLFVEFNNFTILDSDENEDEPYIIPFVIIFDGTTIFLNDLRSSTIRVMNKGGTHGNIPLYYGGLSQGESSNVHPSAGYYEFDIVPIGIQELDNPLPPGLPGSANPLRGLLDLFGVQEPDLVKGTFVWVGGIMMEKDNTSTATINKVRDEVITGLRKELNGCLQSYSLLRLAPFSQLESEDQIIEQLDCGGTLTFPQYLQAKLEDIAKSVALENELTNLLKFLPGLEPVLMPLFTSKLNNDDYIGFAFRTFNYEEIFLEGRPIKFELDYVLNTQKFGHAAPTNVHYKVSGNIGRCTELPRSNPCCCIRQ